MEETEVWQNLRGRLNNSYDLKEDWIEAIELFKTRLNTKFFDPLENLISESNAGAGFTIVAVQCALIESLASFKTGQIFNHNKNAQSPNYEYRGSADMFKSFLYEDPIFMDHFYTVDSQGNKTLNQPYDAHSFYSDVRCGLLHEARTKNEWLINFTKDNPKKGTTFLAREGNNIKIYRSVLHYRLKHCVNSYCLELSKLL